MGKLVWQSVLGGWAFGAVITMIIAVRSIYTITRSGRWYQLKHL